MTPREDLMLCATAIALGYSVVTGVFTPLVPENIGDNGLIPKKVGLGFRKGCVSVFDTARGWRVAKERADGTWEKPISADFHDSLLSALKAGASLPEARIACPLITEA